MDEKMIGLLIDNKQIRIKVLFCLRNVDGWFAQS